MITKCVKVRYNVRKLNTFCISLKLLRVPRKPSGQ